MGSGDVAVGDVAVGDVAVGDVAVGDVAVGDVAVGDVAVGDAVAGTTAAAELSCDTVFVLFLGTGGCEVASCALNSLLTVSPTVSLLFKGTGMVRVDEDSGLFFSGVPWIVDLFLRGAGRVCVVDSEISVVVLSSCLIGTVELLFMGTGLDCIVETSAVLVSFGMERLFAGTGVLVPFSALDIAEFIFTATGANCIDETSVSMVPFGASGRVGFLFVGTGGALLLGTDGVTRLTIPSVDSSDMLEVVKLLLFTGVEFSFETTSPVLLLLGIVESVESLLIGTGGAVFLRAFNGLLVGKLEVVPPSVFVSVLESLDAVKPIFLVVTPFCTFTWGSLGTLLLGLDCAELEGAFESVEFVLIGTGGAVFLRALNGLLLGVLPSSVLVVVLESLDPVEPLFLMATALCIPTRGSLGTLLFGLDCAMLQGVWVSKYTFTLVEIALLESVCGFGVGCTLVCVSVAGGMGGIGMPVGIGTTVGISTALGVSDSGISIHFG